MTDRLKKIMLATTLAAATFAGASSAGAVTFEQAQGRASYYAPAYAPGPGYAPGYAYGPAAPIAGTAALAGEAFASVVTAPFGGPAYAASNDYRWHGTNWEDLGYGRVWKHN